MWEIVYNKTKKKFNKKRSFIVTMEEIQSGEYYRTFVDEYKRSPMTYKVREFYFGFLVNTPMDAIVNMEHVEVVEMLKGERAYKIRDLLDYCETPYFDRLEW